MKFQYAKFELTIFCQRSGKYSGITFGDSESIEKSGCLICAIATGIQPFVPSIDPKIIVQSCQFTPQGYLVWRSVEALHPDLLFVWRYRNPIDFWINFRNDKNFTYIFEINGISNPEGSHWVTFISQVPGYEREVALVADPFDGSIQFLEFNKVKGGAAIYIRQTEISVIPWKA